MSKIRLVFLLLIIVIVAGAAMVIVTGPKGFAARNAESEYDFRAVVERETDKQAVADALQKARLHVHDWGRAPDEYLVAYRRSAGVFDELSDFYYRITGRGSRRLTGSVFFDHDDRVSSYTLSSKTNEVFYP